MKTTIYTLLFSTLFYFPAQAQVLVQSGAEWEVLERYDDVNPGAGQGTKPLFFRLQDSVATANGLSYYLKYDDPNSASQNVQDSAALLRQVGQQVFLKFLDKQIAVQGGASNVYYDTTEFLLYDFGLATGDTVLLRFDLSRYTVSDTANTVFADFYVFHTDSVATNGGKAKRILLMDAAGSGGGSPTQVCFDTLAWVEGVGSTIGPLYNVHGVDCMGFGEGYFYRLCSFHIQDSLVFPQDTCETIGLRESVLENHFRVFPNPSDGLFSLQWDGAPLEISVIDFVGKEILEKEMESGKPLDLQNHSAGIYILRVSKNGKFVASQKIIKY